MSPAEVSKRTLIMGNEKRSVDAVYDRQRCCKITVGHNNVEYELDEIKIHDYTQIKLILSDRRAPSSTYMPVLT